jgi:hypothetical protein
MIMQKKLDEWEIMSDDEQQHHREIYNADYN